MPVGEVALKVGEAEVGLVEVVAAVVGDSGIASNSVEPGAETALPVKGVVTFPQGTDNLLIEVFSGLLTTAAIEPTYTIYQRIALMNLRYKLLLATAKCRW